MSGHDDKVLAVDWSMPQYMLSGGADNHLKIFKYNEQALYTARWHGIYEITLSHPLYDDTLHEK